MTTEKGIEPHGDIEGVRDDALVVDELEAKRAASVEHRLGFKQSVKIYKKALFWSAMVSMVSCILAPCQTIIA